MNGLKPVEKFLVFSAIAAAPTIASAGEFGPTSRTSISISVTVPPRVEVRGVADIKIADLLSRNSYSQLLCVLTNSAGSTYSVTFLNAEDSTGASSHQSAAGVPISLRWSDQANRSAGVQMEKGETAAGFKATLDSGCNMDEGGGAKLTVQTEDGAELALRESIAPLTLLVAPD